MKKITILLFVGIIGYIFYSIPRTPNGIDVSHYNKLNFDTLSNNIKFCYVKATEGTHFIDPKVDYYANQVYKKDIYLGFYHFFRTSQSGKAQFEKFDKVLQKYPSGLIPVIDVENDNNNYNSNGIKQLNIFIHCFHNKYGYYPIIYYGNVESFTKTFYYTLNCKWWVRNVPGFTIYQRTINNLDYNYTNNLKRIIK